MQMFRALLVVASLATTQAAIGHLVTLPPYRNGTVNGTAVTTNSTKKSVPNVDVVNKIGKYTDAMVDMSITQGSMAPQGKTTKTVKVCRVRQTGELRYITVSSSKATKYAANDKKGLSSGHADPISNDHVPVQDVPVALTNDQVSSQDTPSVLSSGQVSTQGSPEVVQPGQVSAENGEKVVSSGQVETQGDPNDPALEQISTEGTTQASPSTQSGPPEYSTYTTDGSGQVNSVCIKMTYSDPNYYFNQDGWQTYPEGTFGSLPNGKMCVPTGFGGAFFVMKPDQITSAPQHHTKAECTFEKSGRSWCNISIVDGYSAPMQCYANGQRIGGGNLFKSGHGCSVKDHQGNCINRVGPSGSPGELEGFFAHGGLADNYWSSWKPEATKTRILSFNIQDTNDFYCHIG